jgi:hypothetical protein
MTFNDFRLHPNTHNIRKVLITEEADQMTLLSPQINNSGYVSGIRVFIHNVLSTNIPDLKKKITLSLRSMTHNAPTDGQLR